MRPPETEDITALLIEVNEERPGAWDKLMATTYDELRAGAERVMRQSVRPGAPRELARWVEEFLPDRF